VHVLIPIVSVQGEVSAGGLHQGIRSPVEGDTPQLGRVLESKLKSVSLVSARGLGLRVGEDLGEKCVNASKTGIGIPGQDGFLSPEKEQKTLHTPGGEALPAVPRTGLLFASTEGITGGGRRHGERNNNQGEKKIGNVIT